MNRPASMKGGSLFHFWSPYEQYIKYDPIYGDMDDVFGIAQSYMNIVEVVVGVLGLILHYIHKPSTIGAMLIYITSIATLAKTILYFIYDEVDPHPRTASYHLFHPLTWDLGYVGVVLIPTAFWVICPAGLIWSLGEQFIAASSGASRVSGKKKN